MLAVGALETWTWWSHLSNFRLDVLVVVFSGSHTQREREREGGWGGGVVRDRTELMAGVHFAFSSMPKDMHADEKQARFERELKCKSEESDKAHRPAVSIRLSRSLGFPTCLFLASPLSGPHERGPIASRKEQVCSFFSLNTACLRKAFNGVKKGQVHSEKHKP